MYTVILVISTMMPVYFAYKNLDSQHAFGQLALILPLGAMLLYYAFKLYKDLEIKSARKLMLASLIHNPLIFITYLIF
jgi:heme o synthase